MALGYWVLPNIVQYWVVLGPGQYFYWLSYPIPILLGHIYQLPADDSTEIGDEVKLECWQIKELKMKYNKP